MQSTAAPKETDPHDTFEIKPDVVLAARADKAPAKPASDGRPSAPQGRAMSDVLAGASAPSVNATFRAAAVDTTEVPSDRPATGKWARRALMSFLFGLCSAVAAAGWTHYGDAAKAMAANWVPKYILASSSQQEQPGVAEQPGSPVLQATAADQTAAQPVPPVQSTPSVAPSVAAPPAESAQLLQSMGQQIEQLKASIEQLNAGIEQLKTGQEQMSREIARNSEAKVAVARTPEQNLRYRIPPPPLRSAAAPARKPRPAFAPAQTAAAPMLPPTTAVAPVVPLQPGPSATAQPEVDPVVRPPMPMRSGSAFP